jgi:hypothetical protein
MLLQHPRNHLAEVWCRQGRALEEKSELQIAISRAQTVKPLQKLTLGGFSKSIDVQDKLHGGIWPFCISNHPSHCVTDEGGVAP